MWRIPKPTVSAIDTYTTCISRVADKAFKQRLDSIIQIIQVDAHAYDQAADQANLHLFPQAKSVGNNAVSRDEMESVYTDRMAKIGAPGRAIYDQLLISGEDSTCPFCGHRDVSTLDHVLAKSRFPSLAVTPWNLVPCCADCNKTKGNRPPNSKESQFLHPYYDDVQQDLWLACEIIEDSPPGARFFVVPHPDWDDCMSERVQNQFNKLKLGKLYASQGGRALANIKRQMISLSTRAGAVGVRNHLLEVAESHAENCVNCWQTALYRAASKSDWYCGGGFNP